MSFKTLFFLYLIRASEFIIPSRWPGTDIFYGWHQLNGQPIQPLYTGHINWWVDYSHGIRLISRKISVDGKEMDYTDVLKHPLYQRLLCDEDWCDFFRYPVN
jgi:hypothetical protein